MYTMIKNAVGLLVLLTLVTGAAYPLVVTVAAQTIFSVQANGSLVVRQGKAAGSALLAQDFTSNRYFWPRPSAAGYDAAASAGSNLGPTSQQLIDTIASRAAAYREGNGLPAGEQLPADAVTASASGLDPDISLTNALLQADRVAAARGLAPEQVRSFIHTCQDHSMLGILGEGKVNVLQLNLALDDQS